MHRKKKFRNFKNKTIKNEVNMEFRRFLGDIAKTFLALSALTVSAYAGANEYQGSFYYGGDPSCCPPPCEPVCCPAPTCNAPPHCPWGYNPPAYAKCGNGATNFADTLGFEIDLLYWRTSVQNLALGTEETVAVGTATSTVGAVNRSYVKRPSFDCDAGFRIGLSHFSPCDCYDVALNWTHYHTKATVTGESEDFIGATTVTTAGTVPAFVPSTSYTAFVPFWERANGDFGINPDFARGRYVLDTDLLDLEFGHKYYVTSCFVFRPHVGLRGGRIDQSFHVESFAARPATVTVGGATLLPVIGSFPVFTSSVRATNDFLGIGPRVGFDIELDLGCGFAIVGKAAGSILFGSPRRHSYETFVGTGFTGSSGIIPGNFEYRSGGSHAGISRTISDLAVGVQWEHCVTCCNHSYPLVLSALWEHHGFYNFNDFDFESDGWAPLYNAATTGATLTPVGGHLTHPTRVPSGDIFTQGLTFSVKIGF